uniref:Leader peptide 1 n=1 Tax=Staphylococcus xylosus TaxID=1288 RepID=A0A077RGP7_STAXY|nr:leader peptide 1 [Staphylococcus xylosus]
MCTSIAVVDHSSFHS